MMDWREIVVILVAVALVSFALVTPLARSYRRKKGKTSSCCGGKCASCKYGDCPYCGSKDHGREQGNQKPGK